MKMRKILEKRAAKLKAKLASMEERAKSETLTRDELSDIESQVEEVTTELGDVVEDLGAATDEIIEEVTPTDEPEPADNNERSRVLGIIGKGISSRGEEKVKKLSQRSAFLRYLAGRITPNQARSFGVGFHNGKVLVPEELNKEIISYLQEENPLRKFATVHKTKGTQGFPVQVKQADANIVQNERDSNNLVPETDIEFTDVYLNPIEFDAIIKVTKKLTHMSDFDIEAIVLDELKKAYLRKETFWYFTSPENEGALAKKAVVFAGKGDNDYLKVVQLKNALPTAMRSGARFMINRAAQTLLESMLDNNGNPILKDSGNDDFDYKLLTYPVEVTDYTDKFDAITGTFDPTKPAIYFGNFSYFHIQDVIGSMEIEKLTELFTRENKVGFKIYHINDGQLIYGPFETPVYSLDLSTTPAPNPGE